MTSIFYKLLNLIKKYFTKPEWEYIPEGWAKQKTDPKIKGWFSKGILDAYISKWPSFQKAIEGTGPLGVGHENLENTAIGRHDLNAQNTIMCFAYVLALASHQKQTLSLMDFGGGIGHYYPLAKALLPDVKIEYSCKDVDHLAEYGKKLFPEAKFYSNDSWTNQKYDLFLASGSLQYCEDWKKTIKQIANCTSNYVFITRIPCILQKPSYVCVQRTYKYGYDTEYLGWVFNKNELLDFCAQSKLKLMREFLIKEADYVHNAPEQSSGWGFLFKIS